jgi:hypothetical protein
MHHYHRRASPPASYQSNATLATIIRLAGALDVTPAELLAEPPP